MTNARPYRPALQVEEAVRRLEEGAGSQWDPEVTAVFVQMVKRGKVS
jgi:HD-GYP domain-containing protein (c-di-GMP phosphodiesterase class II)